MLDRLTLTAFAAGLLLSAGLLFNIQPMVGKMLLPLVGGTPAVWNVAMAFFQMSLLLGYFVAHVLNRMPPVLHALAYVAALALASLALPIALPADWQPTPGAYEPFEVLGLLVTSVAAPFVALSLSAPTLQRLFSSTKHQHAADPYFLYVASNLGSFAGLLIYPILLEPRFDVLQQTLLWKEFYMGLIGLSVVCLLLQMLHPAPKKIEVKDVTSTAPSWKQRAVWVALAAIPSSLTLGVTTYITSDVSPTPMMWVLTLGIYLLTYIVAFARRGEKLRSLNLGYYQWAGCIAISTFLVPVQIPWPVVAINLLAFTMTALACHTLLSRSRPKADRLTEFYFWLALGGAIGGSFNAFLAPVIFNQLFEYPIMMMVGLMMYMPSGTMLDDAKKRQIAAAVMIVAILIIIVANLLKLVEDENIIRLLMIGFVSLSLLLLRAHRFTFGVAGVGVIMGVALSGYYHNRIFIDRDFFGVVSVMENHDDTAGIDFRVLNHGNTTHGMQIIRPKLMNIPTAYYSPISPIADVFNKLHPKDVAIIGLGSGGLNCFAKPDSFFHFIEIDPLVVQVAKDYFTFITDCKPPEITVGDGRLELAKDTRKYNAVIIDAFSSDSIPVHVITTQAVQMYLDHLKPGGFIVAHVSSRFFRLEPMLAAIAEKLDLQAWRGISSVNRIEPTTIHTPSEWVVLAPRDVDLRALHAAKPTSDDHAIWQKAEMAPGITAWSDGFSNLLAVLKWVPVLDPLHQSEYPESKGPDTPTTPSK